ncbi:MAG: LamG domain-containing protein [Marinobacterium sp.]|nr:LamG domain-containing protein [Marinobacterium sp.]
MSNLAMDMLMKSYSDKNYKYPVLVRHKGSVIGFAMDDECRIWYTVLDLNSGDDERGALDVSYWLDDPQELQFTCEIVQTGFSVAGATRMPVVKKGGQQEDETGLLAADEIDPFWSSTGRLTADAPFQVLSDNKYLYLFRQSRTTADTGMVFKLNNGAASGNAEHPQRVLDSQQQTVPVVNDTLLCDRFVLSGTQMLAKQEVRYRRSRHKTRPASNKDSLGAKDMAGVPFFEPTQELDFIRDLKQGRFTVLRLPTQASDLYRWQFFAYNEVSEKIDSFNMEQAADGLFDTLGQDNEDGNIAMQRTSFRFKGRTLQSGLSAALYHQQEKGLDGQPMRTAARVMLSAATSAEGETENYLATIDFSVSRQGLLTEVTEEIALPEVDNSQAAVLEQLGEKEAQAQALRAEIRRLSEAPAKMAATFDGNRAPVEIPITEKQAGATYTFEGWIKPQKITRTQWYQSYYGGYNREVTQDWYGVITHKGARLHHLIVHKSGNLYLCTKTTTTGNDVTQTPSPVVKWGQWQHVAVTCDGQIVRIFLDGKKVAERKVNGTAIGDSNAIYIGSEENQQGKFKGQMDDLRLWNHARSGEQIRASMKRRIKEPEPGLVGYWLLKEGQLQDFSGNNCQPVAHPALPDELSPIPGSWVNLDKQKAQLQQQQDEIAQLRTRSLSGLSRAVDYLHMDPQGLTLYGAVLKFAHASDTPQLLDSATGKLALYFRGSNGQFFAAYHDTRVSRHQKQLTLTNGEALLCQATVAGEEIDSYQIRITESTAPELCTVLIEHPDDDLPSEQWLQVPRDSQAFARVLNGLAKDYSYGDHASASKEGFSLSKGSFCFRVAANVAGTTVKDGIAESVQAGATSRWVADAPGQARVFDGQDDLLCLPEAALDQVTLDSSLTMEAWLSPSASTGVSRVISQKAGDSGYSLGIEGQPVDTALAFNGSDTYVEVSDWNIAMSKGFSFEAWVRFERFSGCARIIDFGNGPYQNNLLITHHIDNNGFYLHANNDSERVDFVISDLFKKDTWQHLAVTIAPDGMTTVYCNGVHAGQKKMPVLADMSRRYCYIGKSNWRENKLFKGQMDDIRIWNQALSEQQIQQSYQKRLSGNEENLLAYWQCRGNQLQELTGAGLNCQVRGTLKTAKSVLTESSYTVFAEVGSRREQSELSFPTDQWNHFSAVFDQSWALQFDGNGWLNAGNDVSLSQTGALTLEAYFMPQVLKDGQTLISKGSLDAAARTPYSLQIDAQGRLQFAFQDDRGNTHRLHSNTGAIKAGQFHRVAVVRKENFANPVEGLMGGGTINVSQLQNLNISVPGTGGVETVFAVSLHVDGRQVAQQTFRDLRIASNEDALTLAGDLHNTGNGFEGCLSEVRIWSRALAPRELAVTVSGKVQGLLAHWLLEENRGNLACDSKGNNHARLNGGRWIRNPDPQGSTLQLFNNGVPLITRVSENAVLLTEHKGVVDQLTLGGLKTDTGVSTCFSGTLEEVRLWKTVRTQEQLLDNLFTRLKGEKADLIANYCFDGLEAERARDEGLRGNHLQQTDPERQPIITLSSAPVSNDTAQVRSALAGIRSAFHSRIDSAPYAQEYADLQYDADNALNGVMKRCYSYIEQGQWKLITGYKVGNLVTEWVGQAQFDPQIMGYMEGPPPVPSENMTYGTNGTGTGIYEGDGSTVELVQATEVNYNYSASREQGFDAAFENSMSLGFEADISTLIAPLGFGISIPIKFSMDGSKRSSLEASGGWVEEKNATQGTTQTRSLFASLGGNWEDPDNMLNPDLGRRWDSANMGFAIVQSETADVFALRLEHNGALVSFRFQPNPDIPRDWNIVSFPINPRYCKQGTLDGKVGYDAQGHVVCDPDYPQAASYGEHSYYKPRQAYALKRNIERQQQELASYYRNYGAAPLAGGPVGNALKQGTALDQMLSGAFTGGSMSQAMMATSGSLGEVASAGAVQDDLGISDSFSRRDIANTYVWSADGGIFKETEQMLDVVQQTTGGDYSFTATSGHNLNMELSIGSVTLGHELDISMSGSMNLTQAKTKESTQSFSLEANVTCSGDMQRHDPHTGKPIYRNGAPDQVTGRVDAYRWMTFYQQPSRRNFEDLFSTVVDPIWLEQSDHPGAVALRQARQTDRKPPCWRVNHIVTFVSRVLPEFVDDASIPMAGSMKKLNINSNWELIRRLEPFVKNRTADPVIFADAVRQALQQSLPELLPHAEDIIDFLGDYYAVDNIH